MSPIAYNTFHFATDVHLVLSRAAHVSVLLGELVDHGDQVQADEAHTEHPLPLLGKENEVEDEAEEEDENKNNDCNCCSPMSLCSD